MRGGRDVQRLRCVDEYIVLSGGASRRSTALTYIVLGFLSFFPLCCSSICCVVLAAICNQQFAIIVCSVLPWFPKTRLFSIKFQVGMFSPVTLIKKILATFLPHGPTSCKSR